MGFGEDSNFLLHLISSADAGCLQSLDSLIRTQIGGKSNWAVDRLIAQDAAKRSSVNYKYSSFWDLVRYVRNKISHHAKDRGAQGFKQRFETSEDIVKYFNENVVEGGDLVFAVWEAINYKTGVNALSRFGYCEGWLVESTGR